MPTLHSTLTGSELHEPKGVESALSNTVYKANGSGSGTWSNVNASEVFVSDPDSVFVGTNVEQVLSELYQTTNLIEGSFSDVSNVETVLLPIPFDCEVLQIKMILSNGITVANSTVTVTRSDGAAMGSQVISYVGSSEGTSFTFVPSSNEVFSGHNYIKLVSDGGSTTSAKLYVQALIRRS